MLPQGTFYQNTQIADMHMMIFKTHISPFILLSKNVLALLFSCLRKKPLFWIAV